MIERYRQLFANQVYAMFLEDAAGWILDANAAAARLLECSTEEIVGRNHSEFLAPVTLERLLPMRRALKPEQRLQIDAQYIAKGGRTCSAILEVALIRWGDHAADLEKPAEPAEVYLAIVRESSKLDELERELRLQRQSAYASYSNSQHATFFISARNEISPYPPRSGNETERPLDWVHALLPGARLKDAIAKAWAGEEVFLPPAWFTPLETRPRSGDARGERASASVQARWLKIGCSPMRGRGAEVTDVCVHVLDSTAERLASEEQRRVDQRVSAALLTSTLHHELNNYLAVIMAQASGLRLASAGGHLPPPHLGAIIDAAQNAAALLRQSADISHHGGGEMEEIEINALIADCAFLLPHQAGGRITVEIELEPDIPHVRGDADAIRTMLLELMYHAELRIAQGGKMTVRSRRGKPPYPGMSAPAAISILDNTPRASVQQPNSVEGAESEDNLQLALARAILREHRGQLEVVHSALQGRTYEVLLPGIEQVPQLTEPTSAPVEAAVDEDAVVAQLARTAAEASNDPPSSAINAAVAGTATPAKHQKILLADDEENFRSFTSWVLKERGYEVLVANDGQEAFERFQEAPSTFDLVILDAYMPRMGGLEAYLRMQVLRPELPVLFASGFVRGATADALLDGCPGPAGVILKPFSSEDLLKAVEKALTPEAD